MTSSRTADKFVVRMPDGVRSRVEAVADLDHISMNTFVVQAIEEKLARSVRQELLLDALELASTSCSPASQDATGLIAALTESRQVIAAALKLSSPDWFKAEADIASHYTIKMIDDALAAHRSQQGAQP